MSLGVAVAGLGAHGARYARHLLQGDIPGARLTAVSRSDEAAGREFARANDVEFVADPRALAEHPDVDAVALVLPPHLHPACVGSCLKNGTPVLVEKPLAPDAVTARRLAEQVRSTGGRLMVAQTLRFDAVVQAAKREIATLGPLRSLALHQRFEPSDRSWIDTPGSGGLVLNTGVHGFDLMRYLTDLEPTSVQAETHRAQTSDTEDVFTAMVRLEPGPVLALIDNTRATESRSGRIEIVGERGQIWGDHVHRTLERVFDRTRTDLGPVPELHTVPATIAAFVDAVRSGSEMPITVEDGLAAVEMVEAALISARESRRVLLSELR